MTVFICHSSRDHAAVRSLVQHLQTAHESVWLDQSLIGGEAWWQRILHQIRSCTVFVVALSNSCLQSKPCRAEMDYAKALGLPVLPVIIGDVDSYRIDPIFAVQSVDLRNPDAASGAALIAAVRERAAERKELADPLPDPPPIPYEFLQRLGVAIDSPEELSPTEQSTMLADLRQALRQEDDESVREDIRRLLRALRRRSEVTLTTVDEIDDLMRRFPGAGDSTVPPEQGSDAAHTAEVSTPGADSPAISVGEPAAFVGTESPKPGWGTRNPKTVAVAAGAGALIAIIAVVAYMLWGRTPNKPATSASQTSPPVPMAALDGLLLSPGQIDSAMGATGMGIIGTYTELSESSASIAQPECRTINDPMEASSYNGSGWTALRKQHLQEPPQGTPINYFADQGVALFASADNAATFFAASAKRWPACSNRTYIVNVPNEASTWSVGPVSNADGTLSVRLTQEDGNGWGCQRALSIANNLAIDVLTCSYNPTDAAVNIAHQIAANVAKQ
jgi:serine/threonine kinase PknH